jgi:ectoine hydroxylase-related dioxygenase (phytanoyl-CoA dioxygenase family)
MTSCCALASVLLEHGFAVVSGVLADEEVTNVIRAIETEIGRGAAGVRQPHEVVPAIRDLVSGGAIRELVEAVVGKEARVVRSILFDKTAERNWGVPWHQDLTIAVAERLEVPGFTGWSVKEGVNHVQAPREVLEGMLTVRLHLDDCGVENGPLRVLAGTHRHGWLDSEAIESAKREAKEKVCLVQRGGAVLLRPLLLHASSRGAQPGHRRVLHLEFASGELPGGLRLV